MESEDLAMVKEESMNENNDEREFVEEVLAPRFVDAQTGRDLGNDLAEIRSKETETLIAELTEPRSARVKENIDVLLSLIKKRLDVFNESAEGLVQFRGELNGFINENMVRVYNNPPDGSGCIHIDVKAGDILQAKREEVVGHLSAIAGLMLDLKSMTAELNETSKLPGQAEARDLPDVLRPVVERTREVPEVLEDGPGPDTRSLRPSVIRPRVWSRPFGKRPSAA
jgi:hypothetical protein